MKTTKPVAGSSIQSIRSGQIRPAGEAPRAGGANKPSGIGAKKSSGASAEKLSGAIAAAEALRGVSDRQLLSGIGRLSETERETVLDILVHLIEIDRRRLYLESGYGSLFEFCVKRLKYCESTAGRRIRAARCIRDYPAAYRLLCEGRIALSNVVKISGVITAENSRELLSRIEGSSARDVDLLVSSQRPKSAIRDRVRPVYVKTELLVPLQSGRAKVGERPTAAGTLVAGEKGGEKSTPHVDGKKPSTSGEVSGAEDTSGGCGTERRVVLEQRFKIEFGADQGFLDKLERVRSLLSTKHHRALEFSELFEILLDEHIERHSPEARARRKQKREQGLRLQKGQRGQQDPKKQKKQQRSRYIPRSVRDEVYRRDGGRCAYVSASGRRCCSQFDLQIDHIVPFARGGDNSAGNLRLLCGKHNRLEAKREFGQKHMEKFVKEEPGRYRGRSGPVSGGAGGSVIRDKCDPVIRYARVAANRRTCGALDPVILKNPALKSRITPGPGHP